MNVITVTELMARLREILNEHGDIPVVVADSLNDATPPQVQVEYGVAIIL
ncbi:hypothetical protein RU58_00013 [Achromobacter phage phiAxp-1]|nr:hypothetical protein RU58_00013 [Achromobacter phage phiAxp-1]AKJ71402.1 hypothetical protein RU58_00013 [Achromobacter phage phiAxp-1]